MYRAPEPEPEPETDEYINPPELNGVSRIYVPDDFYCPISGELMDNPVSSPKGHSYEKEYILKWLTKNKVSPLTKDYLDESLLYDNISMKRSISSIKNKLQADQLKIDSQVIEEDLNPIKLDLKNIQINQFFDSSDNKLLININTPDITIRPPIDIVLCIDVSYSMYDEATLRNDMNEKVSHGISVLSLTILAAKTIINSLNDNDHISIVTYSSEARVIVKDQPCSAEIKVIIEKELDNLKPVSNTNMWAGLMESLDILRLNSPISKNKAILLLTDGIPNVCPPRGHTYMLKKYLEDYNFNCMVNYYGFGYNLDSELLLELSRISPGDGYSFIPDSSILGSVFINGISNILSTALYNPKLSITLSKGALFNDSGSNRKDIHISSLKYGKQKNLLFNIDTSSCSSNSYDYLNDFSNIQLRFNDTVISSNMCMVPQTEYLTYQTLRYSVIDTINHCIDSKKYNDRSFEKHLNNLIKNYNKELMHIDKQSKEYEYIKNILFDLSGQVKESLNMTTIGERDDWFSKWGIHYLRSLQEAYRNEICNNFKDKGVQNFTHTIFNNFRDTIQGIFESMPPPKTDIIKTPTPDYLYGRKGIHSKKCVQVSPITSNRDFYQASGGCCSGDCRVLMQDNNYKLIHLLKPGDKVKTYLPTIDGTIIESISSIECIIKTKCIDNMEMLVQKDNLNITPYHPVINRNNNSINWSFPISFGSIKPIQCPYIYTFVIKDRRSIMVEGYIFSTLGHNLSGDIIYHDFFGTSKSIEDLKSFQSYNNGVVTLEKHMFKRSKEGMVNSIKA